MPKLTHTCARCNNEFPADKLNHARYRDVYLCDPCLTCDYTFVYALEDASTFVLEPTATCLRAVVDGKLTFFTGTPATLYRNFGLWQSPDDGQWYFDPDPDRQKVT